MDAKRMRGDAYSPAVRKGTGRNANIILSPVKDFTSKGVQSNSAGDASGAFSLGDRVYHDAFGEGEVQGIKTIRGKEMVDVRFATGKISTFFTDGSPLEKLARD